MGVLTATYLLQDVMILAARNTLHHNHSTFVTEHNVELSLLYDLTLLNVVVAAMLANSLYCYAPRELVKKDRPSWQTTEQFHME